MIIRQKTKQMAYFKTDMSDEFFCFSSNPSGVRKINWRPAFSRASVINKSILMVRFTWSWKQFKLNSKCLTCSKKNAKNPPWRRRIRQGCGTGSRWRPTAKGWSKQSWTNARRRSAYECRSHRFCRCEHVWASAAPTPLCPAEWPPESKSSLRCQTWFHPKN